MRQVIDLEKIMDEERNNEAEELEALAIDTPGSPTSDLNFISDVPLKITVELGRAGINMKSLLQIGQGTVIELEKLAGEPLEVLVNNRTVAKGEVVVVNDKYGIRLTDIINPAESKDHVDTKKMMD